MSKIISALAIATLLSLPAPAAVPRISHCVFDGTSKVARPMTPDQDHRSLGVDVAINIIADPDWDEDRLAAATRKRLRAGLGR